MGAVSAGPDAASACIPFTNCLAHRVKSDALGRASIMEAERINEIEARIEDLSQRSDELRRYL
jgi:hypothetical protein